MIALIALLTFALVSNSLGGRWLRSAKWVHRAPGLAIVAWQALTATVLLAIILAGLALALPALPASASLATMLRACVSGLRAQYDTPGGLVTSVAGLMLAAGVAGRVIWCLVTSLMSMRRVRRSLQGHLMMTSRLDRARRIRIVEHEQPAVYCLPGPGRSVVFTSAALAALDERQIRSVIAHERAHLSGRHDLVVALSAALRSAVPFLASMTMAHDQIRQLVEMRADDVALRSGDRLSIATALVRLAEGPTPAGALGAGGALHVRLTRLARPPQPVGIAGRTIGAAIALLLLVAPFAIAVEPAFIAAAMGSCPLPPVT